MRTIIAVLVLFCGVSLVAQADTGQTNNPQASPNSNNAIINGNDAINKNNQQSGDHNNANSNDNINNNDESGSIYDPDPEADVPSDEGSPPAQQS